MRSFTYRQAEHAPEAVRAAAQPTAYYLAGGTNLLDLMRLDVLQPDVIVDRSRLQPDFGAIRADASGLHLCAMVPMADAAEHPDVLREYPVIAQSL